MASQRRDNLDYSWIPWHWLDGAVNENHERPRIQGTREEHASGVVANQPHYPKPKMPPPALVVTCYYYDDDDYYYYYYYHQYH